jgi:hypothetical protein
MKLFNFGRVQFSEADARKLQEIIHSPEVQARLDEADKCKVAKRVELRQQLDSLDARHDPAIEAAAAKCGEAASKIESLRVQLRRAEEAHRATVAAVSAVESAKSKEDLDVRRELCDTRDKRLDEYYIHLDHSLQLVRHCVNTGLQIEGHDWLGRQIHKEISNVDEVNACMALLKDARSKVEALALEPLPYAAIGERLTDISNDLAPVLKKFSLSWPALSADGEVVELRNPHDKLDVLKANGVATIGDLPPEDRRLHDSRIRKAELDALASGPATIGDLGKSRGRGARAGNGASVGGTKRSAQWLRNRQLLDDMADR